MFSDRTEAKFKQLVDAYPRKRSALIPVLLVAQHEQPGVAEELEDSHVVGFFIDALRNETGAQLRGM